MAYKRSTNGPSSKIIAEVRQFNRFYTRSLGLLDRQLLDSPFTITEARVLYELAHRKSTTASLVAADLALDLGYLSRILKSFERHRYIKRERSAADSRHIHIRLTQLGRRQFLLLDKAAHMQIGRLVAPLPANGCDQLVTSMHTIQDLLTTQTKGGTAYDLRGLRPGDVGWVTHRQALLYHQEYGWDINYEALVAEILGGFVKSFDADLENAWIAEQSGRIIGSVFLVRDSDKVAKLRLLYVEPSARGLGIGRRLVDECIAFARAKDYETLTLWTNDVLISARKIYEAAGFRLMREEHHHSFGKDLVGQTWELALRAAAPSTGEHDHPKP